MTSWKSSITLRVPSVGSELKSSDYTKPAAIAFDLVQAPMNLLLVNLKAAKAIGLTTGRSLARRGYRVVASTIATRCVGEQPVWVMGGCIELRTARPHHPNNRTQRCAGSAWVRGVPAECVLSMG
jgi:hypothetical protein